MRTKLGTWVLLWQLPQRLGWASLSHTCSLKRCTSSVAGAGPLYTRPVEPPSEGGRLGVVTAPEPEPQPLSPISSRGSRSTPARRGQRETAERNWVVFTRIYLLVLNGALG